jgi:hypothetical protein
MDLPEGVARVFTIVRFSDVFVFFLFVEEAGADILDLLLGRDVVDAAGWARIDAAEVRRGAWASITLDGV